MHIKSIELIGFKSYATRTVIEDFDPKFNAITGLNGSGKSNILDAICFVLGITSLQHVRVANLQELVYKQGQAGVTKASVTIVFDNRDPSQKPVGYEQFDEISVCRQVIIGGKNKYLINGHNAQASQVATMFRSVQLNVNNPHFLIMQGRITKVLNMKPEEIRDMIQEVLGTLMYETEKVTAQKKMVQKDAKVKVIEDILTTQITPKVEKLREERQRYLQFSAAQQEVARLARFLVAHEYYTCEQSKVAVREEAGKTMELVTHTKANKKQAAADAKQVNKTIEDLSKRKHGENGPLEEAQRVEKAEAEALVRASTARDHARDTRESERSTLAELETRLKDIRAQLASTLSVAAAQTKEEADKALANTKAARAAVDEALVLVEAAESGVGADGGLQEQIMKAQADMQAHSTAGKQAALTLGHLKKELIQVKAELEKEKASQSKNSVEALMAAVEKINAELAAHPEVTIDEADATVESELGPARDTLKELRARVNKALEFNFNEKAVDASKVFGRVAKLIQVNDPERNATALEVAAGGKLYNVVTSTVAVGKSLLEGGKLAQRVTIIPLDGVSTRLPDASVLRAADKATGDKARLALDLVGSAQEVRAAMEHVFGSTLVCETMDAARACAFDKQIRMRAVTLDGDLFDPSGTLTGGSKSAKTNVLLMLHSLAEQEAKVAELEARLDAVKKMRAEMQLRAGLLTKLQRAQHDVSMAQAVLADSKAFRLAKRQEEIELDVANNEAIVANSKKAVAEIEARIKALEADAKDVTARKAKLVAEANKTLKERKKQLVECEEAYVKAQKRAEAAAAQLATAEQEATVIDEQITVSKTNVAEAEARVDELEAKFEKARASYTVAKSSLDKKRQALSQWDDELRALEEKLAKANEAEREADMELKRLEGRAAKAIKDEKETDYLLAKLLTAHPWVEQERQFFGKAHTEYDFEDKDVEALRERHKQLENKQADLARKINKKALAMMEKAELEYDDLDKKRRIIERDRATIERVIEGLDKKKNEALLTTFEKVNKDFGSIFSTLLPGARAELRPPEGLTVLDGVEVRVAFGETWKESLTELSGGQRSLLALSLVLALLRFKPAPMYILDEIDAALDLSHTQNIGQMLKTHFSQSQFIIVSLKEGMFTNANCLFRTRFVDGLSTVTRTAMQGGQVAKAGQKRKKQDENENEASAAQ